MITDAFINALWCFIAIHGSNQGSNFVGANHERERALKEVEKGKVAGYLTDKQCDFHMNTPDSSSAGGCMVEANQDSEKCPCFNSSK